jgi:hypothetical protein
VGGDALRTGAEDGVVAVQPVARRTAGAGLALVAGGEADIVEIAATRALQQVAAGGGHVAKLRGSARDHGLRQQRVALAHQAMVGEHRVARHGADAQAAVRQGLDRIQWQPSHVDQQARLHHAALGEIDEIRAAGQEHRAGQRPQVQCLVHAGRAAVVERPHREVPAAFSARTMFG